MDIRTSVRAMRPKPLIATSLAVAAAAVSGGFASRPAESVWYAELRKPRWQPPSQAFPIAWTLLYTDIAASSAITIGHLNDAHQNEQSRAFAGALGVNLVLNASWSWLFFKRRALAASAVTAAALTVSSADLTRRAARVDPRVGLGLSPYPLWCGFATVLATRIWQLNR